MKNHTSGTTKSAPSSANAGRIISAGSPIRWDMSAHQHQAVGDRPRDGHPLARGDTAAAGILGVDDDERRGRDLDGVADDVAEERDPADLPHGTVHRGVALARGARAERNPLRPD